VIDDVDADAAIAVERAADRTARGVARGHRSCSWLAGSPTRLIGAPAGCSRRRQASLQVR
jgi:hypothetical protein